MNINMTCYQNIKISPSSTTCPIWKNNWLSRIIRRVYYLMSMYINWITLSKPTAFGTTECLFPQRLAQDLKHESSGFIKKFDWNLVEKKPLSKKTSEGLYLWMASSQKSNSHKTNELSVDNPKQVKSPDFWNSPHQRSFNEWIKWKWVNFHSTTFPCVFVGDNIGFLVFRVLPWCTNVHCPLQNRPVVLHGEVIWCVASSTTVTRTENAIRFVIYVTVAVTKQVLQFDKKNPQS